MVYSVHTSYLNQGQRSTDKDLWKLIIIYTNGYNSIPVLAGLKNQKNIKDLDSFDYLVVFALFNLQNRDRVTDRQTHTRTFWLFKVEGH